MGGISVERNQRGANASGGGKELSRIASCEAEHKKSKKREGGELHNKDEVGKGVRKALAGLAARRKRGNLKVMPEERYCKRFAEKG